MSTEGPYPSPGHVTRRYAKHGVHPSSSERTRTRSLGRAVAHRAPAAGSFRLSPHRSPTLVSVPTARGLLALLGASHPGPVVAVTSLTALLASGVGHDLRSGAVVTAAVAAGQLSIGWSNDLVDASRDRQVGRRDKPLARGQITEHGVRVAVGVALVACVALSLACGTRSAVVHLSLGVASGLVYNLAVKRTVWSAAPYAVAFGSLPAVVTLALAHPQLPPVWMVLTGALIGVGAHLLNALPDLADDARTGVNGWPQRLGPRRVRLLAPVILVAASAFTVFGPGGRVPAWSWALMGGCLALGVVAAAGRGRVPFLAAVSVAALDVMALVLRS